MTHDERACAEQNGDCACEPIEREYAAMTGIAPMQREDNEEDPRSEGQGEGDGYDPDDFDNGPFYPASANLAAVLQASVDRARAAQRKGSES